MNLKNIILLMILLTNYSVKSFFFNSFSNIDEEINNFFSQLSETINTKEAEDINTEEQIPDKVSIQPITVSIKKDDKDFFKIFLSLPFTVSEKNISVTEKKDHIRLNIHDLDDKIIILLKDNYYYIKTSNTLKKKNKEKTQYISKSSEIVKQEYIPHELDLKLTSIQVDQKTNTIEISVQYKTDRLKNSIKIEFK